MKEDTRKQLNHFRVISWIVGAVGWKARSTNPHETLQVIYLFDNASDDVSLPLELNCASKVEEQTNAFPRGLHVVQDLPLVRPGQSVTSF